ncbi:hypothetical protein [Pseudomonas sp. RL_15y_Pfl2_60]|uniref:hypothetical protein n=1 Tax=Pseudomonas sp. RL_15y_Pfl2_60 TaxID=3088709 RepID=UPI0030D6F787
MEGFFFIALFFLYIPFLFGLSAHLAIKQGFPNKSAIGFIARKIRYSDNQSRHLILVAVVFAVLMPAFIYKAVVNSHSAIATYTGITSLTVILILSILIIANSATVKGTYKKYTYLFNSALALVVTINISRATSYAENIVVNLTNIRASEIPTGLAWLTIVMLPVAWIITTAIFSIAVYAVALLGTTIKNPSPSSNKKTYSLTPLPNNKTNSSSNGYILACGFAMLALAPLNLMEYVLKTPWAEKQIRKELVQASFHSRAEKCGVENIDGAKIAYVETGKAIIAVPDEKLGYTFTPIECDIKWRTVQSVSEEYKRVEKN